MLDRGTRGVGMNGETMVFHQPTEVPLSFHAILMKYTWLALKTVGYEEQQRCPLVSLDSVALIIVRCQAWHCGAVKSAASTPVRVAQQRSALPALPTHARHRTLEQSPFQANDTPKVFCLSIPWAPFQSSQFELRRGICSPHLSSALNMVPRYTSIEEMQLALQQQRQRLCRQSFHLFQVLVLSLVYLQHLAGWGNQVYEKARL